MAIENFNEIPAYLEANKDNEDVRAFVSGLNPVTTDRVKSLVDTDKDLKSWLDSERDKHSTKSLETWKANNLQKEVEALYKKNHPDADPKDLAMAQLKAEFDAMKSESTRKELTNKALLKAQQMKLPTEIIDHFIGADEETTNKNLEKFMSIMAAHDEAIKLEFAKGNSYTPPKGGNIGDANTLEAKYAEALKNGNMPLAISLKNKIFEEQNKK